MKFYLIALMAVFLISGSAAAQHANFGIKGGLNFYNINNDNDVEYDMKTGFHLGALAHFHLGGQWALQPEIYFSTQGAKSPTNSDASLNLNYINVPVLFQYMFDNGFRIQAGPQIGLLVSAKSEVGDTKTDVKEDLKGIDAGVALGMSYVHPPSGFGVDARYNLGLANINDAGDVKSTNRGFQVGVFYLFGHRD